jgi:hypothetical protein
MKAAPVSALPEFLENMDTLDDREHPNAGHQKE